MAGVVTATVVIILLATFAPIYHIQSDSETLDVFIIDGQSNAAYKNETGSVDLDVVNADLGTPTHKLYYYGNSTRPTMYNESDTAYAIRPIYSNGAYVVGGLVAPFAYYLSQAQNRDILVLDVGISAQSISNLVPGSTGGDWKVTIITNALNSITGYDHINMLGWTWLQGESDKSMTVATYIGYFNDLEAYYTSLDCSDCYIVKTRESVGGNATIAQAQEIASNPNIHLGTDITDTFTGTSYMLDNLHYNQAARILIAEAVSEVIPVERFGSNESANVILAAFPALFICALIVGFSYSYLQNRD